jgi:hypothetical protein
VLLVELAQTMSSRGRHLRQEIQQPYQLNVESNEIENSSSPKFNRALKLLVAIFILADLALLNNEMARANVCLITAILSMIYLKVWLFDKYLHRRRAAHRHVLPFLLAEELLDPHAAFILEEYSISSDLDVDSKQQQQFVFIFSFKFYYYVMLFYILLTFHKLSMNNYRSLGSDTVSFILIQCKYLKILERQLLTLSYF